MKKFLLLLIMFQATGAMAQEKMSIAIYQDLRLALFGDEIGNEAGTLDLIFRGKIQGKQQKYGYVLVFPELEYAAISSPYKRLSINGGYTFNQWISHKYEATATFGYGTIIRPNVNVWSASACLELAFKVTPFFKINAMSQFTERNDLKELYGKLEIQYSGFLGVEFSL